MRTVSWFSCGAASAVATKLALAEGPALIVYTEVIEEHPDNKRFLADCEKWYGQEIIVLRNETYKASIYEVFRKQKYLVGAKGAPCTRLLKREMRKKFELPDDRQVFGYTVEEQARVDRFIDANNDVNVWVPLIEKNLTKGNCLSILDRAGIKLPTMYQLGYNHNNCIGCVKGGAGYWNKIRTDFPLVFERMAKTEVEIGATILKLSIKGVPTRVYLKDLSPEAGRDEPEADIECGPFCLSAESTWKETIA